MTASVFLLPKFQKEFVTADTCDLLDGGTRIRGRNQEGLNYATVNPEDVLGYYVTDGGLKPLHRLRLRGRRILEWRMMMAVNLDEAALYRMQLQLIRKHFQGLRPRPVKIDNDMTPFAEASEPAMLFNLKIHRSKREVTQTLIHELIHYELADKGKNNSGHGRAFLKRAKALGLLEDSQLLLCSQLEEEESIPHTVEFVSMPLADAATEIDKYLDDLQSFVIRRVPISIRIPLYEKVKSIKVLWTCYQGDVNNGKDHIVSEN